jgi:hypothetical protein
VCLAAAGCGHSGSTPTTTTTAPASASIVQTLARGGESLSDAFYTCLLNEHAQGIPFQQIEHDCEAKVDKSLGTGADATRLGAVPRKDFDPASVQADCAPNERVAEGSGEQKTSPYGWYSWGKANQYEKGLTEAESRAAKEQAIKEYEAAQREEDQADEKVRKAEAEEKKAQAAAEKAAKAGDKQKAEAAKKAAQEAEQKTEAAAKNSRASHKNAEDKRKEADADPNQKEVPVGESSREASECEQALQNAREILFECNRTGWKSADCQQLLARMHDCPDPATIYVDPELGYSCGEAIDPEALKAAWIEHCERLKDPGPEGHPCTAPTVDGDAHYVLAGKIAELTNICKNPYAHVDPGESDCVATVEAKPFGTPQIHQLTVWGLNHLGGPIVVLPDTTGQTPPHPGPGGDTGPKPGQTTTPA